MGIENRKIHAYKVPILKKKGRKISYEIERDGRQKIRVCKIKKEQKIDYKTEWGWKIEKKQAYRIKGNINKRKESKFYKTERNITQRIENRKEQDQNGKENGKIEDNKTEKEIENRKKTEKQT